MSKVKLAWFIVAEDECGVNHICVCVCACTEMGYDRYKFIVQVVIGEQRGQGVK